jgi:hypothetical protein
LSSTVPSRSCCPGPGRHKASKPFGPSARPYIAKILGHSLVRPGIIIAVVKLHWLLRKRLLRKRLLRKRLLRKRLLRSGCCARPVTTEPLFWYCGSL